MVHKQYRRQTTKKCREFTRTGGELNIFTSPILQLLVVYQLVPARYSAARTRYSGSGTRYSASGTRYSEPACRYSLAGTRYSTAGTVKQFFFSFLFLFSLFSKCDEGYQIQYILERFSRDRAFLMDLPKRSNP